MVSENISSDRQRRRETAVERVVVLAEPSEGGFGEAAIEGISRWTLTEPISEECRTNLFTMVSFVLK